MQMLLPKPFWLTVHIGLLRSCRPFFLLRLYGETQTSWEYERKVGASDHDAPLCLSSPAPRSESARPLGAYSHSGSLGPAIQFSSTARKKQLRLNCLHTAHARLTRLHSRPLGRDRWQYLYSSASTLSCTHQGRLREPSTNFAGSTRPA